MKRERKKEKKDFGDMRKATSDEIGVMYVQLYFEWIFIKFIHSLIRTYYAQVAECHM